MPPAAVGVIAFLGVFAAYPVAVLPAQSARRFADRWMHRLVDFDRANLDALLGAVRGWPRRTALPIAMHGRVFELALYTDGRDRQASAVAAEMVSVLAAAKAGCTEPDPQKLPTLAVLEENWRLAQDQSAMDVLRRVANYARKAEQSADGGFRSLAAAAAALEQVHRLVQAALEGEDKPGY